MVTPVVTLSLVLCCGDNAGTDGDAVAVARKGCGDTDTGMDVSDDNDNIFGGIDDDACTGTGNIGTGVDISDDTDLVDGGNGSAGMDIGDDTGTC